MRTKNALTIQINDLSALERLIGGDAEVELDIKRSIIEKFAVKHLRALVNDTAIERIGNAIKVEVGNELLETVKTGGWSGSRTVLTEKTRSLIQESLQDKIKWEISEVIRQEIGKQGINDRISELVEKQADWIVNDLTSSNLEARLDRMVDKKLKERLGLK